MPEQPSRVAISTLAVVAAFCIAAPHGALALFPGDCGKPTTSGMLTLTSEPVASDSLAVMRAAVNLEQCVPRICDVDNSGLVTAADSLRVLKRAVGQFPVLTCPSECKFCANAPTVRCTSDAQCPGSTCSVPTGECTCDEDALIEILKHVDDNPPPSRPAPGVIALLHCSRSSADPTVFQIPSSQWTSAVRTINANDAWINGLRTGTTSFFSRLELDPPCYSASSCPNLETGTEFLVLNGDRSGVVGLTVKGFVEGVVFGGTDNTVANMTFDRQCDAAIRSKNPTLGAQIRDTTLKSGCRKCVQGVGNTSLIPGSCSIDATVTDTTNRQCYNMGFHKVTFDSCAKPLELTQRGAFLVKDSVIQDTITESPDIVCDGAEYDPPTQAADFHLRLQGNTITDCTSGGMLSGQNAEYAIKGNTITENSIRGLLARKNAVARLDRNVITDNGGSPEADAGLRYYGGIAIGGESGDTADVRLGDSTSEQQPDSCSNAATKGCNTICGNRGYNTANNTYTYLGVPTGPPSNGGPMEIHNGRGSSSGHELLAENNYWCSASGPPTAELYGKTNYAPYLTSAP